MNYIYGANYVKGAPFTVTNNLPIVTIAADSITFPIEGAPLPAETSASIAAQASTIPEWQRWNDYGIGLFSEGNTGAEKGELIQATQAFAQVEKLGHADGPVNLARVYFKEGRLDDTVAALQRASQFNPPASRWTVAWFNGLVDKQNGFLDKAIAELRSILEDRYPELEQRGFDFSLDYEVINELGQAYYERAKMERGNPEQQKQFLNLAVEAFQKALALDSENLTAHYTLALIYAQLGDQAKAAYHRQEHQKYLPDYNAQDRAISIARRADPAADHAAQATVIYPMRAVTNLYE
jgi:tetratricopeptide (TPR) repeat protein